MTTTAMTTTANTTACGTCGKPIARRATGRPPRYCSDNCRVGAYRDRVRAAEAERLRAEEERRQAWLAECARRRAAGLWRPLEEAVYEAGTAAYNLLSAAAVADRDHDDQDTPADLAARLTAWRTAAANLTAIAAGYTDAVTQAASGPAGGPATGQPLRP